MLINYCFTGCCCNVVAKTAILKNKMLKVALSAFNQLQQFFSRDFNFAVCFEGMVLTVVHLYNISPEECQFRLSKR